MRYLLLTFLVCACGGPANPVPYRPATTGTQVTTEPLAPPSTAMHAQPAEQESGASRVAAGNEDARPPAAATPPPGASSEQGPLKPSKAYLKVVEDSKRVHNYRKPPKDATYMRHPIKVKLKGWHCLEADRLTPLGRTEVAVFCLRSKESCMQKAPEVLAKGFSNLRACEERETAYCMRVHDHMKEREEHVCADTLLRCRWHKRDYSLDPRLNVTHTIIKDCELRK